MDTSNDIFDKMDSWRNLPKYQLERRSDLFFATYLKDVLEAKFKPLKDQIIPEFPIQKRAIFDGHPSSDGEESFNVDFLAFAQDNSECFFIELKTDKASPRDKQNKYLAAAKESGLKSLIQGLKDIFLKTKQKRKYFHLFKMLEHAGIVTLPPNLQAKLFPPTQGASKLIHQISHNICQVDKINIVYILPQDNIKLKEQFKEKYNIDITIITFEKFSDLIAKYTDPVTMRFRQSLTTWTTEAGHIPP